MQRRNFLTRSALGATRRPETHAHGHQYRQGAEGDNPGVDRGKQWGKHGGQ